MAPEHHLAASHPPRLEESVQKHPAAEKDVDEDMQRLRAHFVGVGLPKDVAAKCVTGDALAQAMLARARQIEAQRKADDEPIPLYVLEKYIFVALNIILLWVLLTRSSSKAPCGSMTDTAVVWRYVDSFRSDFADINVHLVLLYGQMTYLMLRVAFLSKVK